MFYGRNSVIFSYAPKRYLNFHKICDECHNYPFLLVCITICHALICQDYTAGAPRGLGLYRLGQADRIYTSRMIKIRHPPKLRDAFCELTHYSIIRSCLLFLGMEQRHGYCSYLLSTLRNVQNQDQILHV